MHSLEISKQELFPTMKSARFLILTLKRKAHSQFPKYIQIKNAIFTLVDENILFYCLLMCCGILLFVYKKSILTC